MVIKALKKRELIIFAVLVGTKQSKNWFETILPWNPSRAWPAYLV